METNLFVYIVSHITITGYKTKTTSALHAFKIYHKLSVVNSLNNAPEPALTHLSNNRALENENSTVVSCKYAPPRA